MTLRRCLAISSFVEGDGASSRASLSAAGARAPAGSRLATRSNVTERVGVAMGNILSRCADHARAPPVAPPVAPDLNPSGVTPPAGPSSHPRTVHSTRDADRPVLPRPVFSFPSQDVSGHSSGAPSTRKPRLDVPPPPPAKHASTPPECPPKGYIQKTVPPSR